jgi:putative chitinase
MPRARNKDITRYAETLDGAMREFDISTPARQQAFIAQIAHESTQLKDSQERLNYSAQGLRKVFGKYFRTDSIANDYARKPELIANRVYANRNGNGNEESGDGYLYRGRGLIQLTGRSNYRKVGQALNIDLETNPDLVQKPDISARVAAYFWKSKGLNSLADQGNFKKITRLINGGLNGYQDRLDLFKRAQSVISCPPNTSATVSRFRKGLGRSQETDFLTGNSLASTQVGNKRDQTKRTTLRVDNITVNETMHKGNALDVVKHEAMMKGRLSIDLGNETFGGTGHNATQIPKNNMALSTMPQGFYPTNSLIMDDSAFPI